MSGVSEIRNDTKNRWTAAAVPDQTGRTVVITGGNTGIGFETAKVLAERGATVVLACRDLTKAGDAAGRIGASARGPVRIQHLDLASQASVRRAAAELRETYDKIDLLINNAGLMWPPFTLTEDGFESQFAINHLGHFALTGLVLDRILQTPGARVVTVSSLGHKQGPINFDDLQFARKYSKNGAYAQSKLANLMFAFELQRRLAASGSDAISVAAHPGGARTDLLKNMPSIPQKIAMWYAQPASSGALPTLRAAADPHVRGGDYFGPGVMFETRGHPKLVESNEASRDIAAQRRLWEISEGLTGVTYPI
ncbi:NAD(P)-dependent dehydrogenase (short-subunit alcohol dehydrogenase family) [Actinoplanes octamycinicus]|uniref:NAD(P)-dependent dehydrogenase (Short-subunit alcohol dehydrogenase family) n=1 Tax=Actinoplanes octamycinicus TaxID=135948 RepID=A0A7W7H1Q6_9ACTN|nr:oxidoreductase [Actinoplanes octamycinicus]MBB4742199.1 NAD(P)-dependent dehydrogenase (short-subunit alcohol dehydrogenase family) [Actinoplanes octamycinicus]